MSTIGGPKGATGQRSAALERFLEAERQERAAQAEPAGTASSAPGRQSGGPGAVDRFTDVPGLAGPTRQVTGTFPAPFAQAPATGQGALSVRLGAMTGSDVKVGARAGLRVVNGPGGKVAEGDLSAHKASDLEALRGVVLLRGSLDLSETLLRAADLSALGSLARVDGGLALEGNPALTALDALESLSHVGGNLYLGFNDSLTRVDLPALTRVGGALIVEGNRALEELSLPALAHVACYFHLHENSALTHVALASLAALGGELSLEDNPRLHEVGLPALRVTPPSIS